MVNSNKSEQWLENAISEMCINLFNFREFSKPKKIAEGGFGYVQKTEWVDYGLTVALKCLKVDLNLDENIFNDFVKELRLLRKVGIHPNINSFYGIVKDPSSRYNMVLEYANNGNLRQYLKTHFKSLKWNDKLRIAEEITKGLFFLHNNNIIHRDLHSKNILVHEGRMKIADFGLSKTLNSANCKMSTSQSFNYGMPAYVEPQCFKIPKYEFNIKSDIYSLGVIFWEISSGRPPYHSFNSMDAIIIHVFQGKRETPIDGTPQFYVNLYTRCWDEKPHERPETESILKSLNSFNMIQSQLLH